MLEIPESDHLAEGQVNTSLCRSVGAAMLRFEYDVSSEQYSEVLGQTNVTGIIKTKACLYIMLSFGLHP